MCNKRVSEHHVYHRAVLGALVALVTALGAFACSPNDAPGAGPIPTAPTSPASTVAEGSSNPPEWSPQPGAETVDVDSLAAELEPLLTELRTDVEANSNVTSWSDPGVDDTTGVCGVVVRQTSTDLQLSTLNPDGVLAAINDTAQSHEFGELISGASPGGELWGVAEAADTRRIDFRAKQEASIAVAVPLGATQCPDPTPDVE